MNKAILLISLVVLTAGLSANAQIIDPKKEAKRQGTNRANNKVEQGVDGGFDKLEEGIGNLFKKKKKKGKGDNTANNTGENREESYSSDNGSSVKGKDPEALFAEYGMYPPDGATDVPIPVTIKWTATDGAKRYEFYLNKVNPDGTHEESAPLGVSSKNEYTCSGLEANTTYSWKRVGMDSNGRYIPPGSGGTFTTGDGSATTNAAQKPNVQWSRFDFVPGDEVIFEDMPDRTEENGEFPSRWDLKEGSAEIIQVNGEKVICFPQGGEIVPYLKDSGSDYLPDVFTFEFDAFFMPGYAPRYYIYFSDRKNQSSNGNGYAVIYVNSIAFGESEGTYPGAEGSNHSKNGGWRHISIAFTQGKLKMYMDDTRLINIPRYGANPSGITINCEGYAGDKPEELQYIKNVRIAKGGVKYYDRIMTEGKIVCNGIKFDVNKATLKPESMGPINEIFELLQKQPELKFSIEGHTDSDGDEARNQTLSEQRAKAVMEQLTGMGISAGRLTSKGFGESVPIDNNSTPEGKANNRRVEFVKL